jgi:small-conductance mechanosensitive channel
VATSRLSDLSDNILSWQKIYAGLSPAVKAVAPEQDTQITEDLAELQRYVSDLYKQESEQGKRFTPEEVDQLNAEGQNRATAIAGQISQIAAQLGITLEVQ